MKALITIIILAVMCAGFIPLYYNVQFNIAGYDVLLTSRENQNHGYGLNYKRDFGIWKLTENKTGSTLKEQIYPKAEKIFREEQGKPLPFRKGEELIYDVYCKGLMVGQSVLTFHGEEIMDGKEVYHISFLTKLPFFEDSENIYAYKETFLPLRVSRLIKRMGSFTTRIEEEYDQNDFKVKIRKQGVFFTKEFTIEKDGPIYNAILLTYYYRANPDILKEGGSEIVLPMADFGVELTGRETINTALGKFPVYVFSSTSPKFTFYLSADKDMIPVKIDGHTALDYSLIINSKKDSS